MNVNLVSSPLTTRDTVRQTLAAIRKSDERARKDPEYARTSLIATGMYTKSGKIKKQFR